MPARTSPYRFYQFWLNVSDEDAKKYIRIFSLLTKEEIAVLEVQHAAAPHLRIIQKALASDVTTRVHGPEELAAALAATDILFGQGTEESLRDLSESDLLAVFEGVPQFTISADALKAGIPIIDLLAELTQVFPSKAEARKMIQGNGVSINKAKVSATDLLVTTEHLIAGRYILAQRGKKNYYLLIVG
jgi:tyrosyl-tRNA synthetase